MNKIHKGEETSQCINCESVYNVDKSTSAIPTACCTHECEIEYTEFMKNLKFWEEA